MMRSQIRPCDRRTARDPDRPQAPISVPAHCFGVIFGARRRPAAHQHAGPVSSATSFSGPAGVAFGS
jgi:hypothetical protein